MEARKNVVNAGSFSADTKDALAREIPPDPHSRTILRRALARYSSAPGRNVLQTSRLTIARLFRTLHEHGADRTIRTVGERRKGHAVRYESDVDPDDLQLALPSRRSDRRLELRAAFLACGSLAMPNSGYHLEFSPHDDPGAERLVTLFCADGHPISRGQRRGRPLLYVKNVNAIVDILSAIGAYAAVLRLEDVRALKETKNRIHRLVNTEAANVDRATAAAAVQRVAITRLMQSSSLVRLSPTLREAAELRLRFPSDSLAEIGRRCHPPVGKPTIAGRLNTLLRLASPERFS